MGFSTGKYAKIWAVKPSSSGKAYVAEMSTSRKKQDGNGYETDWSNKFVMLAGQAAKDAASMDVGKAGVTVRIGDCDVTNKYDAEKKTMYTNYVIFSFQKDDKTSGTTKTEKKTGSEFMKIPENADDEELPFN